MRSSFLSEHAMFPDVCGCSTAPTSFMHTPIVASSKQMSESLVRLFTRHVGKSISSLRCFCAHTHTSAQSPVSSPHKHTAVVLAEMLLTAIAQVAIGFCCCLQSFTESYTPVM